ncbi:MAG: DHA2 family efflux MFS transporter permease subunit [Gammaproteobacteria bacterium]
MGAPALRAGAPAVAPRAAPEAAPQVAVASAEHMTEGQKVIAFIIMTIGMFMASLDIQIVASSISEIQAGLSATAEEISLIQTSYLIAEVIMIPLSGWLSRMMSTRWLFTLSAGGFTLASLGCGFAWNIESMVVFRVLQGFIGGAMIPTVFATGFIMFKGKAQTKIPAVLGLVATLAPALGPTIGGLITETMSWRWLFLINIVPGVMITLVVPRIVKIDRPDFDLAKKFDIMGALFLALFLGSLQYVLDEGPRKGWFDSALMVALSVLAACSAIAFTLRSLSYGEPVVDLRAFKKRNFTIGCALSFIVGIGLYGSIYLTPVFLANIRGYSALQIGTTVFVVGVFNIIATPLTVAMLGRVNRKVLLAFGFALFGLSCILFSAIDASWGSGEIFIPQALRGMATLICLIPVTGLALESLTAEEIKGGSGIYNLMRNLGGAVGLALINSELFYGRFTLHYNALVERINRGGAIATGQLEALAQRFGDTMLDPDQAARAALKMVERLATREALTMSFADCFLMITVAFVLALFLIPMTRPSVLPADGAAALGEAH